MGRGDWYLNRSKTNENSDQEANPFKYLKVHGAIKMNLNKKINK